MITGDLPRPLSCGLDSSLMKYFLLLLFLSLSSLAQDLVYLSPESVALSVVPAPPLAGSLEDEADLVNVLKLQAVRTDWHCARAAHEAEGFATSFFGEPYGPLTNQEAQRLVAFQEKLFQEVKYFTKILKATYARPRPFERSVYIEPCIKLEKSGSYPSGHAAISYVAARAFAEIYPDKREAFLERAEVIGFDRVLGGVHHPSDIFAGETLGEEIFKALMESEKFRSDLEELRP
jgi:acid phosphatase (class A)